MTKTAVSPEDKVGALSETKSALLKLLLERKSREKQEIKRHPRDGGEGIQRAPASWAQQRLWFIDRLEGDNAAYHLGLALRLSGALDQRALKAALDGLVSRHEVLRTVFVSDGGTPTQEISPSGSFALTTLDLSACEDSEQLALVRSHQSEEANGTFDLAAGPLIRGRLLQLSGEDHLLLVTMHHIVSDGWSMGIFLRELGELYAAHREGRAGPLKPLSIQYGDYAHWQQQWTRDAELQRQLSYWCVRLAGAPPQLELPNDRARPAVQSYRGGDVSFTLDTTLTTALKSLAQRSEMTLFMVLYAGWAMLLARLSGQADVVIGTPIANRPRSELEGLIGLFVNTLVLRVEISAEESLESFFRRVKEVTLGAYDHQDVPFEKLVEALHPERSLSRHPVFQVMLSMQDSWNESPRIPGLGVAIQDGLEEPAMFDLLLSIQERGGALVGTLNYAKDLFDKETMERWSGCFITLLEGMTNTRVNSIGNLPILAQSERYRVVDLFNATRRSYASEKLIHQLFEEQVFRTPGAIAVVFESQALTYAQLNSRANKLARFLRRNGVGPDTLVGVCVERSLEMVVGLLGTLKAGGAYVPLDPSHPVERLMRMLEDATPKVLLTQERLRGRLIESAVTQFALDSQWHEIEGESVGDLDWSTFGLCSRNLAYVIYTSGSTGTPKGAMNEHCALINRLQWMQDQYQLDPDDRVLQKTPFGFDVSVWEFFWTLMSGARLIMVRPQGHQDPSHLKSLIQEAGVTTLHFVPSMLQVFLNQDLSGQCQSVRHVICSGEELPAGLQNKVFECLPTVQLSNLYGPTEAAIDVTAWECVPGGGGSQVPIGRPISNVQMYVLDSYYQPVPIGVVGELYIGGAGVGRGYLKRPDLTAERFIRDPFEGSGQGRLYKTGDLGRWRADGSIEYLGRNDHQVKIRGFRIEVGEIEAQLRCDAQVKEAVVLAREDVPGDRRLVAYVTSVGESELSVEKLRAHLMSALPEYMVPSAVVVLEALPLSANGKLDRRALPAPEIGAYVSRQYEAPQGEIEEILAGIWQELLRVEQIGRRDNFFELGGHSLLVVQMMERLRRVGLSAEVRRAFESPTLADLASTLSRGTIGQFEVPPNGIPATGCTEITPQMLSLVQLDEEQIERIVRSVPGGAANIQDIYPLAPLQEGILFHHLLNDKAGDTYVLPTLLSVSTRDRLQELIAALQAVINRHDVLRTAVLWEQLPHPVQVVYRQAVLPVEEVSLQQGQGSVQEALSEWVRPERQRLDLREAPLMRLQIAADPHSEQWFALLQSHHIVSDHVTLEIVLAEVVAHLEGRALRPAQSIPYRDHVAQVIAQSRMHNAEEFFRGKLGDVEEPTAPFGLLDVHGDGSRIEESHQVIEADLARRIRLQARRLAVSAATLFHAAWALVVARTSGRDDVVFGSVLLGRVQGSVGAQPSLGMFINTLPLRIRLQGLTARRLVEQVQRELIELLIHEQSSLAVAQSCSGIAGSAPLFSALLNYRHSAASTEAEWSIAPGVRVIAGQERSNYPITLSVDDFGEGFALTVKTHQSVEPSRVTSYVCTVMQSLVEALEEASQTPALALSVLPLAERNQVLRLFNATQMEYPQEKLVHELFEEQVARTPDAVAAVCDGQALTYAELNARANQLARTLRGRGVRTDQLVGLYLGRSLEMVVGLLGTLKAGGAYLPLDPGYPAERLEHMLTDADPRVVLIQDQLKESLRKLSLETIALDTHWSEIVRQKSENLSAEEVGLHSGHLAYVIYTSGSTGRSKGVMIEHHNVLNLWRGLEVIYQRSSACQRTGINASFNFDSSVKQFIQILSGRTLCFIPEQARLDARLLLSFLEETQVDVVDCTASQLKSWVFAGFLKEERYRPRMVLVGGEAIDTELWRQLSQFAAIDTFNLYGPTECTVDATCAHLEHDTSDPHIGRPISNVQMYVLDSYYQPVPIGVVGELYIGGAGVGRGYLKRPDLTAERFIRDPFEGSGQGRLYKTGDLGRWRADGSIEYLGRNDHQVKIRGFRIEVGEIEAQLRCDAQVKEAVVLAREDVPGDRRLVAYVTSVGESELSVEKLRAHLMSALPEYMVPSAVVVLEALPLSANGKLDRRALPAPEIGAYVSRQYEAPQGEIEEILAGIWQELLRVEQIGRRDNFFELGGHSLLVVQMMERLRRVGLSAEVRRAFESPTLADLASTLSRGTIGQFEVPPNGIPATGCTEITPQMLSLVQLDEEQIERIVRSVPGGAANIQDIYPLAPLQEGILFHHLLNDKAGDTYVLPTLLSVSTRDRLQELIAALQAVINRHDVLRTAVLWEQLPHPVQVVYRQAVLPVEEVSLQQGQGSVQEALSEWVRPERQRLDLREAPLMRLQIAADPHSEQWFALLQSHHIVSDHVTLEIVLAEVVAHLEGRALRPAQSIPYRDHVAQVIAQSRMHNAEEFFRGKLGDVEEPTAPFGLLDVHGDGSRIEESHQVIEADLARRIRLQARRLAVSAATLFHAAWALVVARTSGRDDVVFGSVLLGRVQGSVGAQPSLGMFINTLPLRIRLQGLTARRLVEQVQRELIELLIHEQSSLAVAQSCSGIAGSAPLFSALLNYRHSAASTEAEWSIAPGVRVIAGQERSNYPITLSVDDFGEGFALTGQIDRRIAAGRMTGYLLTGIQSLVEALEEASQTPALALSVLPLAERNQVLRLFNATQMEYPQEKLVHELFEEQVARTPDAVAAVCDGQSLTYAGLNARANRLAHHLRERGVGPDQLVGLCVERSLEMVVGLLGVLKAGGAYVPLDPSYPIERLAYMLADFAPKVLLTQERLRSSLPDTSAALITLDGDLEKVPRQWDTSLKPTALALASHHLAYVIYTSGSTGQPKGVMVEHRSLHNLVTWHIREFCLKPGTRSSHTAGLGFDASTWEAWPSLCAGGCLLLAPLDKTGDPRDLLRWWRSQYLEVSFLVTPLAELAYATGYVNPGIRTVLIGGDRLRCWPDSLPVGQRLINNYGPTEATVVATSGEVFQADGVLHIGRPIDNTRVYLLDERLQPVPIGVPGELYIGGVGISRGYLSRVDLTAERFVADPFSAEADARMYRSGDLCRWHEKGTIEYLGRNDHQVKIRGFRIEVGEVEAQLMRHTQVKEAVVLAREDVPGDPRLVAYVVPKQGDGTEEILDAEVLRNHLRHTLPEYMVPSAVMILERLPLTPNGKLDRRVLPVPERDHVSRVYEPPKGKVEQTLVEIWQELLGIDRIGRQDNFFELGGHSLLGVKFMTELERRLGVRLPVVSVFRYPTIAEMGRAVQRSQEDAEGNADSEEFEFEGGTV